MALQDNRKDGNADERGKVSTKGLDEGERCIRGEEAGGGGDAQGMY